MADAVDHAAVLNEQHFQRSLLAARQPVPVGVAGECDDCGEDSPRLVGGRCARCRDQRNRTR